MLFRSIIVQERTKIGPSETAGALTDRYFRLGAELLPRALAALEDPAFRGTPQDESKVTVCRKIDKQDGLVDWTRTAEDCVNRFRAFEPWPGTYTFLSGRRIALTDLTLDDHDKSSLAPGEVVFDKQHHCLNVGTGEGVVRVAKLKPAGGKELQAPAFWNGLKDRSRVVFNNVGV